ncbi:NYN domain-containing protein [Marinimicrobium agarilyticum]|uniref:NYN domain-containing protein n=1 Tax=Marinimicrobium agarilyticum TaxID=306546 RepID=UPI000414D436|nr:NYN domain-containing protein [Marinimicrobium agarilyticum]
MEERNKLAVLIDADNINASICEALVGEIAKYGVASVKRAYGDWTTDQLKPWKSVLHEYAIGPMQQFSYTKGKNSTDSSMIIDAMDLLYTERFDGFCLVTSDSDFTKLATRIRESGLLVYGFGEQKTPDSLQAACDKFVFLEALALPEEKEGGSEGSSKPTRRKTKKELNQDAKLVGLLRGAVEAAADDDGWASIAAVGSHIANQSSFDSRNFGYKKLSKLIETTELFDMEKRNVRGNNAYDLYIRDKRTM